MRVSELMEQCAFHVGDPSFGEINRAQWLFLFKNASQDAINAGWVLPHEDDESIVITDNTWSYTVPAGFAYVDKLLLSEEINGATTFLTDIPKAHWEIRKDAGVPKIEFFASDRLITGRTIKVVGQRRPTLYVNADQEIDSMFESFIRERALYFAFRVVGRTDSALSEWRQRMSVQAWQSSEAMLREHPQIYRQLPSAVWVPGR